MNYYIDQILKEKKITSFLEERGIYPVKKAGEKWVYRCPVHAGDKDPSFIVYPEGTKGREYQTYYCYGCHSGITIINLKSDIDGISSKSSVKYFLKSVKVSYKDARDSIIDDIKKGNLVIEPQKEIEKILLIINSTCREHLLAYNDDDEVDFFESFFKEIDKVAISRDLDMLEKIYEILLRGIDKRVEKFQARKEDAEVSSLSWRL